MDNQPHLANLSAFFEGAPRRLVERVSDELMRVRIGDGSRGVTTSPSGHAGGIGGDINVDYQLSAAARAKCFIRD